MPLISFVFLLWLTPQAPAAAAVSQPPPIYCGRGFGSQQRRADGTKSVIVRGISPK